MSNPKRGIMSSIHRRTRSSVPPACILLAVGAAGLLLAGCRDSPVQAQTAADAALAPPASAAAQLGTVPPAVARELDELLASMTVAWNAGDGIAYGNHYSADADVVNPLGAVLTGSAAVGNTHVFLFNPVNGPFRGSTSSFLVRRMVSLTGNLALLDTTVTLTGFAATPPGLIQWAPGVVKTRQHFVVAREGRDWKIIAQHMTAMQPGIPD